MRADKKFKDSEKLEVSKDPFFNSSFAYLERISRLMELAHIAATNDDDFRDWFMVLRQLHIELYPRLTKEERDGLDKLKKIARNNVTNDEKVEAYHLQLNLLAHDHKLIMKNVEGDPFLDSLQGE